ncbi:AtpZ/AtpI family protein [Brevibacillus brevis]|nr:MULTISPECIES: AtpZ/AtpI family protein [unclassified Brevibacillus]MBY0085047.1 AtpZ/AtpI family protein [Brevibacillus brevis]MCE0451260.1 AtpZ/AtpI family protein [Brevibacillus sp. AF8]
MTPALSLCMKGECYSVSKLDNPWRAITLVTLIGVDMAVCVISGVLLGKYLDGLFSTNPLFLMVGLLAGLGIGVYSVYRIVRGYL